jgi:hypothetical protein
MRKLHNYEEVPLLRDLARNDDDRKIFDFISRAVVIARPMVTNAGVPAERVAALRRAFDATLADPAFLEEAARLNLEISAGSGAELERNVLALLATPPDVLEQVRKAIQIAGTDAVKGGPAAGERN